MVLLICPVANGFHSQLQIFSKYVNKWITIATPFQGNLCCNLFPVSALCTNLKSNISYFIPMLIYSETGAPGCVNDAILTGMQFVEGFESFFFVSRWSMHQMVMYLLPGFSSGWNY